MEINVGNIKIERAVTVTFYVLSIILPIPFCLLIINPSLYFNVDIWKLLLISISITGCSAILNFILTFGFFGFFKVVTALIDKEGAENQSILKEATSNDVERKPRKTTKVSETVLYLTFVLNDILACAVIGNLIHLKYYAHIPQEMWLPNSLDTYLIICLCWYSIYFLLFILSLFALYSIIRKKFMTNRIAFFLFTELLKNHPDGNLLNSDKNKKTAEGAKTK